MRAPSLGFVSLLAVAGCSFGGGALPGTPAGNDSTGQNAETSQGDPGATSIPAPSDSSGDTPADSASSGDGDSSTTSGAQPSTTSDGDSGSSSDGGSEPVFGPFGDPVLIGNLGFESSWDDDPTLTGDELEITFNSWRTGNSEIFAATRASADEAWSQPQLVEALSNPFANDTTPEITSDGLVIVISSDRGSDFSRPFVSYRSGRDAAWSTPALVEDLSPYTSSYAITPYDDRLYTCVVQPSGYIDLYSAALDDLAAFSFGKLNALESLNSDGDDCSVTLNAARTEILFEHTDLEPVQSNKNFDLMRSTRATIDDDWSAPMPIVELNTLANDRDPWLSHDGRRLYMASSRAGAGDRLYLSERTQIE